MFVCLGGGFFSPLFFPSPFFSFDMSEHSQSSSSLFLTRVTTDGKMMTSLQCKPGKPDVAACMPSARTRRDSLQTRDRGDLRRTFLVSVRP